MDIKWSKYLYSYIGFYGNRCWKFNVSQNINTLDVSYIQYISNGKGGRTGDYEYDKLSIDIITGSILESDKRILNERPSYPDRDISLTLDIIILKITIYLWRAIGLYVAKIKTLILLYGKKM